jgi:hypothetical protein
LATVNRLLNAPLFSMLTGLSLIIRYFPTHLTLMDLRTFLIQAVDISVIDVKFSAVLNRMLKDYLRHQPRDVLAQFVQIVYDSIFSLAVGLRIVLARRLAKLNVPLPFNSLDEVPRDSNQTIWHQRLSLVFLCGLQKPIALTDELRNDVSELMKCQGENGPLKFEYLSRVLCMLFGILSNRSIFLRFVEDHDLPQSFYALLFNTLASRITPLKSMARKCFQLLRLRYVRDCRIEKHFDDIPRSPERISKFFSQTPDRVTLYVRLSKICPERIAASGLQPFFIALGEYAAKTDTEKMHDIVWLIAILKAFTVRRHVSIPEVKGTLLAGGADSSFAQYLSVICQLFEHRTVPFATLTQKYVIKYLTIFRMETAEYIIKYPMPPTIFIWYGDLIRHDHSNCLLSGLVDYLSRFAVVTDVPIGIFKLIDSLATEERFTRCSSLASMCDSTFHKFVESVARAPDRRGQDDWPILSSITSALVRMLPYRLTIPKVFELLVIFTMPFFNHSDVTRRLLLVIHNSKDDHFKLDLLNALIDQFHSISVNTLKILLPQVIKSISDTDLGFVWDHIEIWFRGPRYHVVVIRTIVRLIQKSEPPATAMVVVIDAIKRCISSAQTELCVAALKLCVWMTKSDRLPTPVYYAVLQQLFSYPKFGEYPYVEYFLHFLQAKPELLESLSQETLNVVITFFQDRFSDAKVACKLICSMNCVFYAAPSLVKQLPFSVVAVAAAHVDAALANCQSPNDSHGVMDLLTGLGSYCFAMHVSREEANVYAKICYKFLKSHPTAIEVILSALRLDIDLYPMDLIAHLGHVADTISFTLIALAAKVNAGVLIGSHRNLITDALIFIQESEAHIESTVLSAFLKHIYVVPLSCQLFGRALKRIFSIFIESKGCTMWDRLFLISRTLLEYRIFECLPTLCDYYQSLRSANVDCFSVLSFLVQAIKDVDVREQVLYAETVFGSCADPRIVFSVPALLRSPRVLPTAKHVILNRILSLVAMDDSTEIEIIINCLPEVGELDIHHHLLALTLVQARRSIGSACLCYLEKALDLLPRDPAERISYLLQNLPIVLWQDRYVPVVVALITQQSKEWAPLFALARRFVAAGAELITKSFAKFIDRATITLFQSFLATILKSKDKRKHTKVITGILRMFHEAEIHVYPGLAQKAVQFSGETHLLGFFLTEDCAVREPFLLPHIANDAVFGTHRRFLAPAEAASVALTFLNEYETARACYSRATPFLAAMCDLNDRFLPAFESLAGLLRPLSSAASRTILQDLADATAGAGMIGRRLAAIRRANAATIAANPFFSPLDKERAMMIEAACMIIAGDGDASFDQASINPGFSAMISNIHRFLTDGSRPIIPTVDGGDPVLLLMPGLSPQFERVCGFTPQGLIAVSQRHIDGYFERCGAQLGLDRISTADWHNLALVTFSIFLMSPTADLFNTAFAAYGRLLTGEFDLPPVVVHEAAARVITLCRLELGIDIAQLSKTVHANSNIFKRRSKIWQFWLPQLVELAHVPWFCTIVCELFSNMSYRAVMYAKKDDIEAFDDVLNKLLMKHHSPRQQSMMEAFQRFAQGIFALDYEERDAQDAIVAFAKETRKLESASDIDLFALRREQPDSPFTRALHRLTARQIKSIPTFGDFAQTTSSFLPSQLIEHVKLLTNSNLSLTEHNSAISLAVGTLNMSMPVVFPMRASELTIRNVRPDIRVISPNVAILRMSTTEPQWRAFILQRSSRRLGFHKSVTTLANTVSLIGAMLRRTYLARQRHFAPCPTQLFEVGPGLLLVPLTAPVVSLEALFRGALMVSGAEWLEAHAPGGTLADSGRASITTFPADALKRRMLARLSQQGFVQLGLRFARALTIAGVLRHLFNAPYPQLDRVLCSVASDCVPLLYLEFDHGGITDVKRSKCAAFRLSPTLAMALGSAVDGECPMTVAIVAKALTNHLESMRSYLEVMVGDEDFDSGVCRPAAGLLTARTALENKFLAFQPPCARGVEPAVCEQWLSDLDHFIAKARSPDGRPLDAIPWF